MRSKKSFIATLASVLALGFSAAAFAACGPPYGPTPVPGGTPYVKDGKCACTRDSFIPGGCADQDDSGCTVIPKFETAYNHTAFADVNGICRCSSNPNNISPYATQTGQVADDSECTE